MNISIEKAENFGYIVQTYPGGKRYICSTTQTLVQMIARLTSAEEGNHAGPEEPPKEIWAVINRFGCLQASDDPAKVPKEYQQQTQRYVPASTMDLPFKKALQDMIDAHVQDRADMERAFEQNTDYTPDALSTAFEKAQKLLEEIP